MAQQIAQWRALIEPHMAIHANDQRERARLFSGMMLASALAILASAAVSLFVAAIAPHNSWLLFFTGFFTGVIYALSRTPYYQWSVRLFVWGSVGIIFFSFDFTPNNASVYVLYFITIPVMIAGFFLRVRETVAFMLITAFLVGYVEYMRPDVTLNVIGAPLLVLFVGSLTAVTSRVLENYYKRAMDSEARYRSLLEANFEGIIVMDNQTARILDVNPAMKRILGYEQSDFIGRNPVDFVIKDDQEMVRQVWGTRRTNVPVQARLQHLHGQIVYAEASMRHYTFRGRPSYVLTILDITDRKYAEALIIESEKRFRAIFNGSGQYISVLDTRGRILEFNQPSTEKFGYSAHEATGKYLWEFDRWAHTEKARERIRKVIAEAVDGNTVRFQTEARDQHDAVIYLDFSLRPISDADGATQMLIAEARDMTAYRIAEARRIEFEQRYQALFRDTIDAVFICTLDGQLIDCNTQAEEMLQISREEAAKYTVYDFVAPQDRHDTRTIFEEFSEGKQTSAVPERRMKRSNGEIFYAETHGMLVTDEDGEPMYIQSMVRDISERKRLEEERFEAALQRERTQLLAHFITNASHHFRTPITNMKTRLYLLPRVIEDEHKRGEQIHILNRELERMQNLLDDLLAVMRLQKSDTSYDLARLAVSQLVREVRQSFEGRSNYGDYQWQWQEFHDDTVIIGDKSLLARALINIIENAMRFTPGGGTIIVRSFCKDRYLAVDVVDSGTGISVEDLPFIFDDFYRGQDAMATDSTTSGLGLTITRMIIERHRGAVLAASPNNGGAHFQIQLPVHMDWLNPVPPLPDEILYMQIAQDQ